MKVIISENSEILEEGRSRGIRVYPREKTRLINILDELDIENDGERMGVFAST